MVVLVSFIIELIFSIRLLLLIIYLFYLFLFFKVDLKNTIIYKKKLAVKSSCICNNIFTQIKTNYKIQMSIEMKTPT